MIDAKLEYLVSLNIRYQDANTKPMIVGYNTAIDAKKVVTPLPPLNNKNIGKICPNTQKCIHILARLISINFEIKYKGIAHFKKSNINTMMPIFLPKTLVTFVAPILREPDFLISDLKNIFEINNPNGIAPLK